VRWSCCWFGYFFKKQDKYHGLLLFLLFICTGAIQYFNTTSFQETIDIETTLT